MQRIISSLFDIHPYAPYATLAAVAGLALFTVRKVWCHNNKQTVFLRIQKQKIAGGASCKYTSDLKGKVIIITGSNTGIGLETGKPLNSMKQSMIADSL